MERIGLSQKIIRMVKLMVETISYSMMVNGSSWGDFGGERGLKQGDPISAFATYLLWLQKF